MNPATYQARIYPDPPCWSLVVDVYANELDEPVDRFAVISNSVREIAREFRLQLHKDAHGFARVDEPVDFAVVLMGRTTRLGLHHCGIFYQGKVLHANPEGTLYQDMPSLRDTYPLMEFWARPEVTA